MQNPLRARTTWAYLFPAFILACTKPSYPDYPSLVGMAKQDVITYCATSTHRSSDNRLIICDFERHQYLYFSDKDEAIRSAQLKSSNVWLVDFRKDQHSIRDYYLEVVFTNGRVTSQKPGYTSDL